MDSIDDKSDEERLDLTALKPSQAVRDRIISHVVGTIDIEPQADAFRTAFFHTLASPRLAASVILLLTVTIATSLFFPVNGPASSVRSVVISPDLASPIIEFVVTGNTPSATDVIVNFGKR